MKPIGFIVPAQPIGAKVPPAGRAGFTKSKSTDFRLMALRKHHGVRLLTRRGHDWTDRYPAVVAHARRRGLGKYAPPLIRVLISSDRVALLSAYTRGPPV